MTTLLHISASPRGAASESLALADTFLGAYRDAHPADTIEHLDLWDGTLPGFGPAAAGAKMAVFAGREPTGAEAAAWGAAKAAFRRFADADRYLFGIPMWNSGIPYVLKQFIDVVTQPGMAFAFDPEHGYRGLLTGKRAVAVHTSAVYGPDFRPGFGSDFAEPYFADWLRFVGIEDAGSVRFRPNLVAADAEAGRQAAHAAARDLGKTM
jgi:FMN-dependent NADH-azoreductase